MCPYKTMALGLLMTVNMQFSIKVLLLCCTIVCANGVYILGNGQPGCRTQKELEVQMYRNLWDPTSFWQCTELNEPAIPVQCPVDTAFLDSAKDCVEWQNWKWEEPVAPLSIPKMPTKHEAISIDVGNN